MKVEIVLMLIKVLFCLNQKYQGSQGKTEFYTRSILYIKVKLSAGERRIAHPRLGQNKGVVVNRLEGSASKGNRLSR